SAFQPDGTLPASSLLNLKVRILSSAPSAKAPSRNTRANKAHFIACPPEGLGDPLARGLALAAPGGEELFTAPGRRGLSAPPPRPGGARPGTADPSPRRKDRCGRPSRWPACPATRTGPSRPGG